MEAHNIITIVSRTIVAHLSDPGDIALLLNPKSRTDYNRKQMSFTVISDFATSRFFQ